MLAVGDAYAEDSAELMPKSAVASASPSPASAECVRDLLPKVMARESFML